VLAAFGGELLFGCCEGAQGVAGIVFGDFGGQKAATGCVGLQLVAHGWRKRVGSEEFNIEVEKWRWRECMDEHRWRNWLGGKGGENNRE